MNQAIAVLTFCLAALATAYAADPLVVEEAWVREAPPGAMALAAYMKVHNNSQADRELVSASSPDFGAVELHRSIVEEGMARMVPQESMPIPAGGVLVLEPGDYHLMLMRPKRPLKEGDEVILSLGFDDGTSMALTLPVRKGDGGEHHHMHDHEHHHQQ